MIPMLRNLCNGTCFDITTKWPVLVSRWRLAANHWSQNSRSSPPVVSKRLVGIRHTVGIFLLLDCVSAIGGSFQNLVCKAIDETLLSTPSRVRDQPSNSEAVPARPLIDF